MRKLIFRILYIPQLVLLFLHLLMRFIPTISPSDYEIMGLLGLLAPALAVINILFLFFWITVKKYSWAAVAAIGIVLSWNVLSVGFGIHYLKKNDLTKKGSEFTLMSYNVRLLDLYDWTGDKNNRMKLVGFIKEKSPDVLCLQEFYTKNGTGLDNIDTIKTIGGYKYVEICAIKQHRNRLWGSVVFSKFPIVKNTNVVINEEDKNLIQETIIKKGANKIKVYNIHLHSNKLSPGQITLGNDDKELNTASKTLNKSKSVINKLLQAYKHRGSEANLSAFVIEENASMPTIVCGDLNDLPSSYSYFNIRGNLKDAFLERGRGIGATYNGDISFLRIDYLFYSEQLKLKAFDEFKVPYSDHYPLIAKFDL